MPIAEKSHRVLFWLMAFLAVSAAYLYTFPQPNIVYAGVVLLHALGGVLAAILLIPTLLQLLRTGSVSSRLGWLLIALGAILGLILIKTGTLRPEWNKLYLHIVFSLAGIALLLADRLGKRDTSLAPVRSNLAAGLLRAAICLAVLAGVGFGARYVRESWQTRNRIQNPGMPPDNMNGEGDGPEGALCARCLISVPVYATPTFPPGHRYPGRGRRFLPPFGASCRRERARHRPFPPALARLQSARKIRQAAKRQPAFPGE